MNKICKQCGGEFTPSKFHPKQQFCCRQCNDTWAYHNPSKHQYTCQHCGKEYAAKHKNHNQYCTRECAFAAKAVEPRGIEPLFTKVCLICGQSISLRNSYCSDECIKISNRAKEYNRNAKRHVLKARPCKECGEKFTPEYGNQRRNFCSYKCLRKNTRRVGKSTRRARIMNAPVVENINPLAVLGRDKWKCHICGQKTPKRLRGTIEDNAPEVDHIIPLAQGGMHTWDNVACACRKCNIDKGSQIIGQQLLPVFAGIQ